MSSCKKDDDNDQNNPSGYFFRANVNGQQFLYEGQTLQSGSGFLAHCGGYVTTTTNLFVSGGLFLEIDNSNTPSEATILALLGDTITVDDDNKPHAIIQFDEDIRKDYTTQGFSQQGGYVVFTEITPLGDDDTGNWNVYAVKGNFKAEVEYYDGDNTTNVGEATGDFYMRLTTNK